MKPIIFLVFLLLITITGCSTTHKITGYSSPQKFYGDCDDAVKDRSVNINLVNDSTFSTTDENKIINDTLYTYKKLFDKRNYKISTGEIKNIDYLSTDYKSADLQLKNGEKLKAENLSINHDTTEFYGIKSYMTRTGTPLNNVKNIEYTNHWKGVIPGILGGALIGGILGATGWIIHPTDGGNHPTFAQEEATFGGAFFGLITGAVTGYIIGFDINYQINPNR